MFEVSPWEVESEDIEFEEVQVIGQRWELAIHRTKHHPILYFRRIGGSLFRANFPLNTPSKAKRGKVTRDVARARFAECRKEGDWARPLFWNEYLELRQKNEKAGYELSLRPDGKGFWHNPNPNSLRYMQIHFQWGTPSDSPFLVEASATQLVARLEEQQDFVFARRYLLMSQEERWNEIWTWKNGDRHELKRTLTWALIAQEGLWMNQGDLNLSVDLLPRDLNWGDTLWVSDPSSQRLVKEISWPPTLRKFFQEMLDWFGPQIKKDYVKQHLCLQHQVGSHLWLIEIRLQNPTAHERIEAALAWREWLAKTQG